MAKILGNFHWALIFGVVLLVAAMFGLHGAQLADGSYPWAQWLRYVHVFAGVLWIGLLYYFNFVQIPTMPKIEPAELKRGVTGFIAPAALFWFRWSALATVILGLLVAETQQAGFSGRALTFSTGYRTIGLGMWLGLIMAANVWFVIWPNQKKALGLVPADDAAKAKAGPVAMMASRTNLILSIPMLYCMVAQTHIGG
ncbi:MAG TPA: urate hydroxylase PuuD [Allosphingosinicella sp.]|jgi:uncharacterized membrane protein|nr:urate hydroxylase PuuD [Allosphingosinicella sp.]